MEREGGKERLGHGGTKRARPIIADRPGTKKGSGPKKLIFDFSKRFLYRAMIKFAADPVFAGQRAAKGAR
jgi:hypothetical protein